jgi:single stranded DNA-binding protein
MSSLNTISIIGNLGADPVLRTTANNTPVCNLRVAVNEGSKEENTTTWFNVAVWGEMASLLAIKLKKGMQVYVSGRLAINSWEREVVAPVSKEIIIVKTDNFVINADDIFSTTDMKVELDSVPVDNIPVEFLSEVN